jgi:hypothetical protein
MSARVRRVASVGRWQGLLSFTSKPEGIRLLLACQQFALRTSSLVPTIRDEFSVEDVLFSQLL